MFLRAREEGEEGAADSCKSEGSCVISKGPLLLGAFDTHVKSRPKMTELCRPDLQM